MNDCCHLISVKVTQCRKKEEKKRKKSILYAGMDMDIHFMR